MLLISYWRNLRTRKRVESASSDVIDSKCRADPNADAGIGYGVVGGFGSTSQQTDIVSLADEGQQYLPKPRS